MTHEPLGAVLLVLLIGQAAGDMPDARSATAAKGPQPVHLACFGLNLDASTPPTVGRRGDHWPRFVRGEGTIGGLVPNICAGFACSLAHVVLDDVKTSDRIQGTQLFGFVSCIAVADSPRYCGHRVRFTAEKIRVGHEPCGFPSQSFPSEGRPFYMVRVVEIVEST